ncbi:MAG: hypothetical protein Q4B57_03775, partial [Eubacteriales bacterium]|nr:hypothetical protein [Eubacteriales bacterium]
MDNIKKKKRLMSYQGFPSFLMIMAALLILFSVQALRNIQQAQFEERVETSNILMEKISHHVKTAANFSWENIHTARNILTRSQYADLQQVQDALNSLDTEFGKTFWLVDETSQCYTATGKGNDWLAKQLLISGNDEFLSEDMQMVSMESRAFYLTPLPQPIQVEENIRFTHLVLVNAMSTLDDYFDISNFAEEGIAFIIRSNGSQVYRHNNNN